MRKVVISLVILIIIVIGLVVIINPNKNKVKSQDDKITIITTVYPIYDFAKEIAGDRANVSMLLSPGVEIHDYEPTPQDIIKIQDASLFLYMGDDLEPWAETTISGIDKKDNIKNVVKNIEIMKIEDEHEHEEGEQHNEEYDTHIWLDPMKSIEIVDNISNELVEKDPENKEYYQKRTSEYIEKLKKLDSDYEETVKQAKRKEVAFGGPFSYAYLLKRYKLSYISAYDSCGESGEPGVDKIFSVIQEINKNKLPVIFYKELSSGNIIKTISEETGAQPLELNSLHSITKEQMENGENYLSIMYRNLENLKKALW